LLPGVSVLLSATKPEVLADQGESIGAHLRRARKGRGLKQVEAAELMGVCQTSVLDWESGTKQPRDRQYPAIISFLGYEPWPKPQTFPEKLIAERRRRGISAKAAATIIGVDEGTFARWETDETQPLARSQPQVDEFLRARDAVIGGYPNLFLRNR